MREITAGEGVDVAYDASGKDMFLGSLDCLAFLGSLVNFGQSSGPVDPLSPSRLAARSSALFRPVLFRPVLFYHVRERAALEAAAGATFQAIAEGVLRPDPALQFPLAEAGKAHRALEGRQVLGPIVLVPDAG